MVQRQKDLVHRAMQSTYTVRDRIERQRSFFLPLSPLLFLISPFYPSLFTICLAALLLFFTGYDSASLRACQLCVPLGRFLQLRFQFNNCTMSL